MQVVRGTYFGLVALAALLVLFGAAMIDTALLVCGTVLAALALVFCVLYYRCPNCGKFAGYGGDYCTSCGESIK